MQIALGPLLYYWSREDALAFYAGLADWPVDMVYLGETVCPLQTQSAQVLSLAHRLGEMESTGVDLETAAAAMPLGMEALVLRLRGWALP